MSKHKQNLPGDKLPLPQPRSPQALDDKILAYAHERAVTKNHSWIPRWTNGWATGLVTASIVAIAVFITETQQPAHVFRESAPLEHERRNAEDAVSSAPITATAPATAKMAMKPALQRKAMKQELLAERLAPQALGLSAQEEFADREIASDTAAAPNATFETNMHVLTDDRQLETLRDHFAQLLQQGHEAQAREAYQALRLECTNCDLPETLIQWLADQPEGGTP